MFSFDALQNLDFDHLDNEDLTTILPFLTKLLLNPLFVKRQKLLQLLYPIKKTNDVIQLMLIKNLESVENVGLQLSSFESCDYQDRLRIVATEYLKIQERSRTQAVGTNQQPKSVSSDLFDNSIYTDDISYCLIALLTKSNINISELCETLLYVKFAVTFIVRIVSNFPDRCQEVCQSLVSQGDRQDEGANISEISERRAETLRNLCVLCPSIAFTIRATTLQLCKTPSLTCMITSEHLSGYLSRKSNSDHGNNLDSTLCSDGINDHLEELQDKYDSAIAFITGILLGVDDETRIWFAQFIKLAQTKRIDQGQPSVLSKLRSQILTIIRQIFSSLVEEEVILDLPNETPRKSPQSLNKSKISPKELNRSYIRATATLRLYCALRGIGSMKLDSDESEMLLRLITCRPPASQTSVNFATTGVCTLLACSALISNQKDERKAAEWLKWLIKESNYSDNRYSSHGKCSISELLLLIAIHFQNNQHNQIAELVCSTLNMKLQIKLSVSKCKGLFVQEVFNDQMIAEHAFNVPVTKNLSNDIREFLPVHCIHQLLESRSFSKYQVPIHDWIFRQICESKRPLHNVLPKLIEAYVNSVIVPAVAHGHGGTNQPIAEDDLIRVFQTKLYSLDRSQPVSANTFESNGISNGSEQKAKSKTSKRSIKKEEPIVKMEVCDEVDISSEKKDPPTIVDLEAAQVLLLYYVVQYEDVRLKKSADLFANDKAKILKYSPDFMLEIPVFYLLQLVRSQQESYGSILPDLIRLVTSQYPQLCSIEHWLTVNHYEPHFSHSIEHLNDTEYQCDLLKSLKSSKLNTLMPHNRTVPMREELSKKLLEGFKSIESDCTTLSRTISQILILPREEIWSFVEVFISSWSRILDLRIKHDSEYKKLVQLTTKLWWEFNRIFPRKLWVMTINSLREQKKAGSLEIKPLEYSWDELSLDPLIVLRCDSRVFRCVDILAIVLHILNGFLSASRRCLQDQISEQPSRQKVDIRNLEELRSTLILAQTSAAVQILLESCLPSEEEEEALSKKELSHTLSLEEELILEKFNFSVNCISEHLHQTFIADTNLAKLVHFQTYPSDLLATTSDKIPSMHICLDFIPELLAQPDLSKQIFVIELTSHLCEKYAITKSLNVAKLCFNVAYTMLQLLPSERRALFFIPVLPALLRICHVFPILREDAAIILRQIDQVTLAHMASTPSRLSLNSERPFEGVEKLSWTETKKLMSKLGHNEALYLCIRKCTLDLSDNFVAGQLVIQ